MFRKIWYAFILTLACALVFTLAASAGGWAVVTLDQLPTGVVAGETVEIGFIIRAHGQTPISDLSPAVRMLHPEDGNIIRVEAAPSGEEGHYTAQVVFPTAGEWQWGIEHDYYPNVQPMPNLEVAASAPPPGSEANIPPAWGLSAAWIGIALLAGAALGAALLRRKTPAWMTGIALVVVLAAGVALAISAARADPATAGAEVQEQGLEISAETGRDLFIAKGCIICHSNHRADAVLSLRSTNMGPDLTHYSNSAEFLRPWLADPSAVRPETQMPTLGLDGTEIEALIAFINAETED